MRSSNILQKAACLLAAAILSAATTMTATASEEAVNLNFSGGHQTDPRDKGRPVALIGPALGVTPEIFREAFARVTPASGGSRPEPAQVRRNKDALLSALARHGVTNEALDRVSDYYRYRPGSGRIWPVAPARAQAVLKDGKLMSVQIIKPGSGYSAPPHVTIPGHPGIRLKVELSFGRDLEKNGSIKAIQVEGP